MAQLRRRVPTQGRAHAARPSHAAERAGRADRPPQGLDSPVAFTRDAPAERPTRMLDRVADASPRRVALTLAAVIVVIDLIGLFSLSTGRLGELFGIDSDLAIRWPIWASRLNVPALVSSGMLALAGVMWWHAAGAPTSRLRIPARGVALFFGFMAVDETVMVHERLAELTSTSWLLLYSPLVLVAGMLAVLLLVRLWRDGQSLTAGVFLAGGLCWVGAQLLEVLQFGPGHRPVDGYFVYVFVEETLENAGSAALLVSGLLARRASRSTREAGAP